MCDKKFGNLEGTYKGVHDSSRKSGRGRKKWQYYDLLTDIIGGEPAVDPKAVELG